uniref:Proopiomelanocortin n=1 Tax=Acanthopagrus latus TaxID=8177 RepID=Q9PTH8_ACALA|nr:proopiomelanocortin [Acanthopagrus latus]WQY91220.1 proopiomelanocortin [Acanthopagrus latus]
MCPVWLLVAVVVVGVAKGAASQCWEHPSCQELNSESSVMECIQLCHSDLTAETPVIPGNAHLQPPPPSDPSSFTLPSSSSSPQAKRSYSMEHFRWGKPVGRKRRPVKVYTSNGVEEESAEVFPGEIRRRELASELLAAAAVAQEEEEKAVRKVMQEEKAQEVMEEAEEEQQQLLGDVQEKKDGLYKMKHFRWSGPPASKRYGGFMKSWDERSQKPLLTLFKNVINKDGQQQK